MFNKFTLFISLTLMYYSTKSIRKVSVRNTKEIKNEAVKISKSLNKFIRNMGGKTKYDRMSHRPLSFFNG